MAEAVSGAPRRPLHLKDARADVSRGRRLRVEATSSWQSGQLQLQCKSKVFVKEIRETWMLCHFEMKEALQGWYPINCLTVATVLKPYVPDASWYDALREMCLPLEAGQKVVVTRRFQDAWAGYAAGHIYGGETIECVFPLDHVGDLEFVNFQFV
jgi:hypothetical protein